MSTYVGLHASHELTTIQTRIRAVDPLTEELFCLDFDTTPLRPGAAGSVYGHGRIIFWATIALAIAYWVLVGIARLSSAWSRRPGWQGRGLLSSLENVGFVLASAISGEGLAKSPALIRFCTSTFTLDISLYSWLSSDTVDEGYMVPFTMVYGVVHGSRAVA